MVRISRRRFLRQGGASLVGAWVAGSLGETWLLRPSGLAASPADPRATDFPGELTSDLAAIVADLERHFSYASALFTAQGGVSINCDRNGIQVSESGFSSFGVSLRVFDGSSFHEVAVGSTEPDAMRAAAKRLQKDVRRGPDRFHIERLGALEHSWRTAMVQDPGAVPLEDRAGMVEREFRRVDWDDPRVRNARVSTNVNEVKRLFVDRTRRLASERTMVSHVTFLIGFDQGRPGFAFSRRAGQGGLELASLTDAAVERLRQDLVDSFGAEQVPAGEYDVVFAPAVSGLLAHESFGHGVEMDQFVKERAKAREFLGKRVAAPLVTLLDDPSLEGALGSYPFDDEGMLAAPTPIIEDGVFVHPLTDLMSATFLGTPRTPNGRTQAWDRKVYARMSNTFIKSGGSDPGELLASLENGLYLEGFRSGIEDPQGWGIQFITNTAREVKNGKLTGRLFSPATVTGYVPEILSNISMVANDFALEAGTCGKGYKEFVPIMSGGPHIRTRARVS